MRSDIPELGEDPGNLARLAEPGTQLPPRPRTRDAVRLALTRRVQPVAQAPRPRYRPVRVPFPPWCRSLLVPFAPVPVPPECLERRGRQRWALVGPAQAPATARARAESAAGPRGPGSRRASCHPSSCAGRVGGEQVGELILLPLRPPRGRLPAPRWMSRLGRVRGEVSGDRIGLDELAVGPRRGGQLGQRWRPAWPRLGLLDRGVLAVDPRTVDQPSEPAFAMSVAAGPLQRADAVPQAGRRIAGPEPTLVQSRTLSSAWASASSTRSISPRSAGVRSGQLPPRFAGQAPRAGPGPSGRAGRPSGGSARRPPPWLAAPHRGEHQAGHQPGGRADQRFGDPAGRGGMPADPRRSAWR